MATATEMVPTSEVRKLYRWACDNVGEGHPSPFEEQLIKRLCELAMTGEVHVENEMSYADDNY